MDLPHLNHVPPRQSALRRPHGPRACAHGVGLIEVLVALAIGSLAAVGLLAAGAFAQQSMATRYHEAVAGLLAQDLGERIRAHQGQAASGSASGTGYLGGAYDAAAFVQGSSTTPPAACNQRTDLCTPAQFAAADLAQWVRLLQSSLPDGQYSLVRRADDSADLWLAWTSFSLAMGQLSQTTCPLTFEAPDDRYTRCLHVHIQP